VVVVVAVHASSVVKKVTGLATAPIQAQVVVEEAVGVGVVRAEAMGVGVLQGMEGAMVVLRGMVVAKAEVGVGAEVGEQGGLLPLEPVTNAGNQAIGVLLAPTDQDSSKHSRP